MNTGYCTNLPNACTKAASKELIAMSGPDSRCPVCGSGLIANKDKTPGENKKKLALGAALMVVLAGIGYVMVNAFPAGKEPISVSPPTNESYAMRLSGSNTIGSALAPQLVKAWLISTGASGVSIEQRSKDGKPVPETVVRGRVGDQAISVEIRAHGSGDAFKHLQDGSADIGMASRPVKPEEKTGLSALGDMGGRANEHVVALDGIAVVVASGSGLEKISRHDLARIFTGEISDWSQFGVGKGAIQVYARKDDSGTYETFKHLVLEGKKLVASARRIEDSGELEAAVAKDPAGIGFIGLPYVKSARALPVSDGLNTVALSPTVFTVRKEDYALSRRLFFYTAENPSNQYVRQFVNFALSPEGQQVVKSVGFVDLTPIGPSVRAAAVPAGPCTLSSQWPGSVEDYCLLKAGKTGEMNFRFHPGSANLDNLAWQDLQRVLNMLAKASGSRLTLIGFADSKGGYEANIKLSEARANAVKAGLRTLGIDNIDIRGFGSELPVADNETSVGRNINRRVEVWVQ